MQSSAFVAERCRRFPHEEHSIQRNLICGILKTIRLHNRPLDDRSTNRYKY